MSLGQRQLIAFIRAVLRQPDLLILDEATANIDTVTEQLLGAILEQLPPTTTKVVIAHRLNTIDNADEIFFVNARDVTAAGSMRSQSWPDSTCCPSRRSSFTVASRRSVSLMRML